MAPTNLALARDARKSLEGIFVSNPFVGDVLAHQEVFETAYQAVIDLVDVLEGKPITHYRLKTAEELAADEAAKGAGIGK